MTDGEHARHTEPVDEQVERAIVRRLDGELDESASAELDRRLVRDVAAHRLMDATAAADASAGDALRAAFVPEAGAAGRWGELGRRLGARRRVRWAVAAAAAVALVVAAGSVVVLLVGGAGRRPAGGGPVAAHLANGNAAPAEALPAGVAELMWHVWDAPPAEARGDAAAGAAAPDDMLVPLPTIQGPRRTHRAVDRHIYGVHDESDDTIYLLGVDRVRTRVHAVGKDL